MNRTIWILICVATSLAPLHWFAMKWVSDRPVFCRDSVTPLTESGQTQCEYPQQRMAIEQGNTSKMAVCRCP